MSHVGIVGGEQFLYAPACLRRQTSQACMRETFSQCVANDGAIKPVRVHFPTNGGKCQLKLVFSPAPDSNRVRTGACLLHRSQALWPP